RTPTDVTAPGKGPLAGSPLPSCHHFFSPPPLPPPLSPLPLHAALPICLGRRATRDRPARHRRGHRRRRRGASLPPANRTSPLEGDRKSTRLNSSHEWMSYAVFGLKKKESGLG